MFSLVTCIDLGYVMPTFVWKVGVRDGDSYETCMTWPSFINDCPLNDGHIRCMPIFC